MYKDIVYNCKHMYLYRKGILLKIIKIKIKFHGVDNDYNKL